MMRCGHLRACSWSRRCTGIQSAAGRSSFTGESPPSSSACGWPNQRVAWGLAGRLLTELENQAARHGVRTIQLETNKSLVEAINLYRSAGYVEVAAFNDEPYAHHWFAKHIGDMA